MELLKNKKNLLITGTAIIAALFYQYLLVRPITDETALFAAKLAGLNKDIEELKTLKSRQEELSSLMIKARSRQSEASSSLASNIETLVDKLALADKALSIRLLPVSQGIGSGKEQKMDIRFDKLGFKDILVLLNEISSLSGNVRIAELNVKKQGDLATMNLVVSSLLFEKE
jgi:hypothetical protein